MIRYRAEGRECPSATKLTYCDPTRRIRGISVRYGRLVASNDGTDGARARVPGARD